jgi:phospho-N-acetylmuramoyl-pentapeptide-transferase
MGSHYITSLLASGIIATFLGFGIAPSFKALVYKYKLWRSVSRSNNTTNPDFKSINNIEETSVPRVGGALIIFITVFSILILFALARFTNISAFSSLDFLSRSQTLLPLGAFVAAAIVGFFDDALQIWGRGKWSEDPIMLRVVKSASIILIGLLLGLWFYVKLGVSTIHIPWHGEISLGFLFVPFFILVLYSVFTGSVIDGVDGLSGGVLLSTFGSYAIITYFRHQYDLSALAVIIICSILVFLWYNIMPAQFYMGETGMLALTTLITVYAFFTDTVLLLPIIVFPLFFTSLSVVLQLAYRKITKGKKLFRVAPIHHHFEAIGWTRPQIVMRFWIIGFITSIIGAILVFVS